MALYIKIRESCINFQLFSNLLSIEINDKIIYFPNYSTEIAIYNQNFINIDISFNIQKIIDKYLFLSNYSPKNISSINLCINTKNPNMIPDLQNFVNLSSLIVNCDSAADYIYNLNICYLINLEYLDMNCFKINDLHRIHNLQNIESLILNCPITSFYGIKNLKKLKKLNLQYVDIDILNDHMIDINHIIDFAVSESNINDFYGILFLTNAVKISIHDSQLSEIKYFDKLPCLKELIIIYNSINNIELYDKFSNLEKLVIILESTHYPVDLLNKIKCPKLKYLNLSYCNFNTDEQLLSSIIDFNDDNNFNNLSNLTIAYSDIIIDNLKNLEKLEFLDFYKDKNNINKITFVDEFVDSFFNDIDFLIENHSLRRINFNNKCNKKKCCNNCYECLIFNKINSKYNCMSNLILTHYPNKYRNN